MLMNSRNNRRRLMTNQIIVQLNPDVPPTGSDLGIVNAARKSFGRRSKWNWSKELESGTGDGRTLKDKDKRLLEFLARGMTADDFDEFKHTILASKLDDMSSDFYLKNLTEHMWEFRNTPTHDTPFNHGFFSFEVKAPVFVARHLVKHEYLIMSEYSRRYITDDVEFYRHEYRSKAEDVKQGSGGIHENSVEWQIEIESANTDSIERYNRMVADRVAPEQARGHLPQDLMTSWTWSGTLGAFANMCKLRLSKDTQYETRLVAQGVYTELKKQFPVAAPLLVEGVL
jgi:thymidylate synthase (FAD)